MKNPVVCSRKLLVILIFILLPSCREDQSIEDLALTSRTDNTSLLERNDLYLDLKMKLDLNPALDLYNPILRTRVQEVRDSIETYMGAEFALLHRIGRQILQERGVDPDTAFSGGPNDPRLSQIPMAAYYLDRANEHFLRHGLTIDDFYSAEDTTKTARKPTGKDTRGPWDDLWDKYDGVFYGASEEDIHDCLNEVIGEVGGMVALAETWAGTVGVGGKALIAFVGGNTVLTVGAGIGIAGFAYGIYRLNKCMTEKAQVNRVTCAITVSLEDYYASCLESEVSGSPKWSSCFEQLRKLQAAKFGRLERTLGMDTLTLVLAEEYDPNAINQ
jgi:hypothetical protein